jgi:hypothetical protein
MTKYRTNTVPQRSAQFLSSWQEFAPDAVFAGMTLAEFQSKAQQPLDVRQTLADTRTRVSGLILDRDKSDEEMNRDLLLVAHAIRATPAYGEDCAFYRSLGYIPKSERRTGRRKANDPATPAIENAA